MRLHRHYRRRLQTLRGMTVVHVGAHEGQEASTYRDYGAAHVIFVEADPERIDALRAHCDKVVNEDRPKWSEWLRLPRPRFTVLSALVGDQDGQKVPFYRYSNQGQSNSVFRKRTLADDRHANVVETGEVLNLTMRRLDNLLTNAGIAPASVDALVLDVQGAELLALRGAPETLRNAKILEVEVANSAWYEGGVMVDELEPWLLAKGFSRATMLRQRSVFQDIIFVRK